MPSKFTNEKLYLMLLLILFLITHGLILFVSGMWVDDWCIVNISKVGLKIWSLEMGKPEFYPIVFLMSCMPDICFKFLILVCHFTSMISFYYISQKCLNIGIENSFLLTIIYMCVPVNDIRIERLNLPYSLGLALFSLAFALLVYKYEKLKIFDRVAILILFFFSYILNSLLVFMGLVWLYIAVKEKNIKKILFKIDFFVIPFLFFYLRSFFPAHGVYADYNSVNYAQIIRSLHETVKTMQIVLVQVIGLLTSPFCKYIFLTYLSILIFILISFLVSKNEKRRLIHIEKKKLYYNIVLGLFIMYLSLFPYVETGKNIEIMGFDSRHLILFPFGFSIFFYSIIELGLTKELKYTIVIVLWLISSNIFIYSYSNYQKTYYVNKTLQVYLSRNYELSNYNTICIASENDENRFYCYNGIFEEVYGDEKRLVYPYETGLPGDFKDYVNREWYNMKEYNDEVDDNSTDCLIVYSNNISRKEAIKYRLFELLGQNIGDRLISHANISVFFPGDAQFIEYGIE